MQLHNRPSLKSRRKGLRHNLTPAEAALWNLISHGKIGKKFRRQHSVGPYILDFYCPKERLAIELDGQAHNSEAAGVYDKVRTAYLNSKNIRVVRFENHLVFTETDAVLETIKKYLGFS